MYVILDANIFISKTHNLANYSKIITTQSVINELKDINTVLYTELYQYNIEIVKPEKKYIEIVQKLNVEKNLLLSIADVDIVALTLQYTSEKYNTWISKETQYKCISNDFGVKQALKHLGIDNEVQDKIWKFRCYCCYKIYDENMDFCKACGYKTITRVSMRIENGKEVPNIKKNYVVIDKEMKDKNGVAIKSEDQREYSRMKSDKKKTEKKAEKVLSNLL
ncbi:hypothetical protein BDAP_001757 [Binucleata daphniae]